MKLTTKGLFLIIITCVYAINTKAQLSQFCIGSPRNEIAIKIVHMPDGSSVIAGYQYDLVGGVVQNAQMVILKVSASGTIAWQTKCGITGTNNLVQDMIVTHDTNIVVVGTVGRNYIYGGNEAAIMKYNGATGALIHRTVLHDESTTTGGELFSGVAELGAASNYELVAVGAHSFSTDEAQGMICVFDNALNFMYDDDYYYGMLGGEYQSVVASANKSSVYICGQYADDYGDGIILSYTPGTTSGVKNWEQAYDFYQNGDLQDNFFSKVFLTNGKLVIAGSSFYDYTSTNGEGQFIFTIDTTGLNAFERSIVNNNTLYANSPAVAIVDNDHVFTVQSPATAFYDPVIWASSATTSAVVTEITSLFSKTANVPVEFNFAGSPGLHSILDMQYRASNLYMAGSTNASGFGNNDIYYIITAPTFASENQTCDTLQDSVNIADTTYTEQAPPSVYSQFTPAYDSSVIDSALNFNIELVCGDEPQAPCFNGKGAILNIVDKNCSFTATINVSTSNTIIGYQWSIPGMPTFVVHTASATNTQTFTLPPGVAGEVCVTVYVVNRNFEANQTPCCDTTICQKVSCSRLSKDDESINPSDTNDPNALNIYPNPTEGNVTVMSEATSIKNIKVFDVDGRMVAEYNYDSVDKATISLSKLIPGNYLLRINDALSKVISKTK